jgi:hypothetical protein
MAISDFRWQADRKHPEAMAMKLPVIVERNA